MNYVFETNENGTVKNATWWIDGNDPFCYATNRDGEGIFQRWDNGNIKQLTGTCQFSIYGLTKSAARTKIRKRFQFE